jgi:hypothetical protein
MHADESASLTCFLLVGASIPPQQHSAYDHGYTFNFTSMSQVPDRMLPPNLHIAVCRFERQELQRGLIAHETEWWLERGMNGPKLLARRALHAEMTYIKATQAISRALVRCRVEHGCITPAEAKARYQTQQKLLRDPAAAAKIHPYFTFSGMPYKGTVASLPHGLHETTFCARAITQACKRAKRHGLVGWEGQEPSTWEDHEVLSHVDITKFRECQLVGCTASSPLRRDGDRVAASTWFEASINGRSELVQVMSYMLVELKAQAGASPLRLAVIRRCPEAWVRDDLAGAACYIAPAAAEPGITVVDVASLCFPCVLVKPSSDELSELRLLPLYVKLL